MSTTHRHHVVVVGGGFGGLPATRLLSGADVDVTLIDQRNHHLFQPLLYQVATGILSPGEISPVLRHLLRKKKNVRVVLSKVTGFDLERRVVHTTSLPGATSEYAYDSLIVAGGAGQSYFGHDEFALIAPGMKTIDDAMELRRRVYGALELAETLSDRELQKFWMTFVIVGAGPTGVELAGQIRELAYRSLGRDFRNIEPATVRVVLVDGGREPLANFGGRLSGRASTELEKMGVELRMGLRVVGVDPFGVDTESAEGDKGRFDCGTVIWAAGVQASPLAGMLAEATGAETDRAGRIAVLPDLSLPGHPEVFAVGDMAAINNLPGLCEVAMQGGLHAANTIKRRLKGQRQRALQVPRPRERRRHRSLQGDRERAATAPQRVPRMGGVAVRAPGLPQRLRPPLHCAVAVGPLHGRERPPRARLQCRAYRRRPEPARRREGQDHAQALPSPRGPDGVGRRDLSCRSARGAGRPWFRRGRTRTGVNRQTRQPGPTTFLG